MHYGWKTILFIFYIFPLCILAFSCISYYSTTNISKLKSSIEVYPIEAYLTGTGALAVSVAVSQAIRQQEEVSRRYFFIILLFFLSFQSAIANLPNLVKLAIQHLEKNKNYWASGSLVSLFDPRRSLQDSRMSLRDSRVCLYTADGTISVTEFC